ncbi:hypothetical protein PHLCEN_2v249 [Hermanssonia centrifuga]|uniref:Cytochrome P450 n=1 Tax=Hermanssonia centrifuga TaxID=98765 RepID=A0A2R6S6I8_9APHY|nr:hypothetical protein PHLCEN_2v249 [Hermanssonia centrifuga]
MAFLYDTNGWTLLTILVLGALALRVISSLIAAHTLRAKMPPGPDGLPFLGNILQLTKHQWLRFLEWSEQYGPIFTLNLAGQRVVVLNDFTTSADLLDRRSTIYSSRPRFIMSGELVAGNMFFGLFPYGNSVIHRINDIPARLGGTIPSLPGAGIVQFLPWMLYLPEWLAGWKRKCREWHESDTRVFTSFLDDAENSKFSGSSESTFTAALVGDEKKYDFSRKEAAWLTGTMM